MILVIDNYDSFVHNLARYFCQLGCETVVVRNDKIDIAHVQEIQPEAIVLSPGPRTPTEAGCSIEIVKHFGTKIPILGICLGHQAIVHALGGSIVLANEPVHGRQSNILHSGSPMFADVPQSFVAGRYHSLVADIANLPQELAVTARTEDGTIMAVEHQRWPLVGLQFHPESILTECGYQLLINFMNIAGIRMPPAEWTNPSPTRRLGNAPVRIEKSVLSSRLSTCDVTGQKTGGRIP
jgi:anthranilate synthase/aminodeoxychorismate synthase-like glutamine amidotransferase